MLLNIMGTKTTEQNYSFGLANDTNSESSNDSSYQIDLTTTRTSKRPNTASTKKSNLTHYSDIRPKLSQISGNSSCNNRFHGISRLSRYDMDQLDLQHEKQRKKDDSNIQTSHFLEVPASSVEVTERKPSRLEMHLIKDFTKEYLNLPSTFTLDGVIPYKYYIDTPIIEHLDLSNKGFIYIDSLQFYYACVQVMNIKKVTLDNNDLTSFPDFIQHQHTIESISLANNNISELLNISRNLTYVNLDCNLNLTDLTGLKSARNLKKLSLELCNLTEIPTPNFFNYVPELQELFLAGNKLTDLPPELIYCRDLKYLDLSENLFYSDEFDKILENIVELRDYEANLTKQQEDFIVDSHSDFFGPVTALPKRDKSDSVPTGNKNQKSKERKPSHLQTILHKFKKLKEINLSGNQLKYFICPPSVETLKIHNNNLVEFQISEDLIFLDVSFNQISEIDCSDKGNLEYLSIESNNLENLPTRLWDSLNLKYVNLKNNYISRVYKQISRLRDNLRFLDLSKNNLIEIHDNLAALYNLEILKINDQKPSLMIKKSESKRNLLNPVHFKFLQNLSILNLENSNMNKQNLCNLLSYDHKNLVQLNLNNNNLNGLPIDIYLWNNVSEIKILKLRGNGLRNLPEVIFKVLKGLEELDLGDNLLFYGRMSVI